MVMLLWLFLCYLTVIKVLMCMLWEPMPLMEVIKRWTWASVTLTGLFV